MDGTIVRILWVAMTIFVGAGLILYIIYIFIIPLKPETTNTKIIDEKK